MGSASVAAAIRRRSPWPIGFSPARARGSIEGEAELFTGDDSDWVGDIRRLQDLGVSSVDVRLFGYGEAQTLQGTIDNMHRFRDGVLSRLA